MVDRCWLCAVTCAVVLVTSAACSSSSSTPDRSSDRLRVVTSTDVYADIAHSVGGSAVDVTALIDNPDADPHSFEADTRDQLAISKADVIIENGGGYDDFVDRLRSASARSVTTLNAVTLSGRRPTTGGELNEHVWYDLPTIAKLVARLVGVLAGQAPAHRAAFRANGAAFTARLRELERTETVVRASDTGTGVAITEPVPDYLLAACGLVDKTPAAFSTAIENDTGVSAAVLQRTRGLFSAHAVRALVYNVQTSGPETTEVLAAARANHVAVVPVTETLPAGKDYLSWMKANLNAVRSALAA